MTRAENKSLIFSGSLAYFRCRLNKAGRSHTLWGKIQSFRRSVVKLGKAKDNSDKFEESRHNVLKAGKEVKRIIGEWI